VTDGPAPEPSLIPPDWYVASFNAGALKDGRPFRSALDPLVMMAWHLASAPPPGPFLIGLPAL
jgi:hypothetical protein